FFFSSRRRHTRFSRDWSSDVCSSDLIALGAIPYFDNSHEGQGEWLSTPRAWPLTVVGAVVGTVGTTLLVFFDESMHVRIYEGIKIGRASCRERGKSGAIAGSRKTYRS